MLLRIRKIALAVLLATILALGVGGGYMADHQISTANSSSSTQTQLASFQWGVGRGIG